MGLLIIVGIIVLALLLGPSPKSSDIKQKNKNHWDELDEFEWSEDEDL